MVDKNYPKYMNVEGYVYKRKKHPNVPKKYKNRYQLFVQDNRKKISEKYPNVPNKEILKILSNEWKNIDSQKLKEYTDIVENNRKEYFTKIKNYSGDMYTYVRCNKKHKHFNNKKRNLSLYNEFLSNEIRKLKINYPDKKHIDIFVLASKNWQIYKDSNLSSNLSNVN